MFFFAIFESMDGKSAKPVILFSVSNCICNDQRVLKMAGVSGSLDCEVTIIGRFRGDCCRKSAIRFSTRRFRMLFNRGFLFYMFFNIRLFIYLLFHRADILVANDLDTLLPNFLASRLKHIPLVYDSHEYFTGVPELQDRPFVRWIWKSIERRIFPRLEHLLTVSDSIAIQYLNEYGLKPVTIRNCSLNSDSVIPFQRTRIEIKPGQLVLILQGTGINRERGGEELIEALKETDFVSLIIAGTGDIIPLLKKMVLENGMNTRVRFLPPMEWIEMMRYTKSADAGLSLDKNTNANHRFSLPNKLFDYISAGIPVIAGDLPEVTRIISDNNCGIIIPQVNPGEIVKAIRLLDSNRDLLEVLKKNARLAAGQLSWERESEKVKAFYNKILDKHGKN